MSNYVSLLSPEYRRALELPVRLRAIRLWVAAAAGAAFVLAAVSMALTLVNASRIEATQKENQRVQQQIAELSEYDTLHAELAGLENKVLTLYTQDAGWISIIADTADALPDGVWLQRLSTAAASGDRAAGMELECSGNRYEDIAHTMTALRDAGLVEDVRCTSSAESGSVVRFVLTATLTAREV